MISAVLKKLENLKRKTFVVFTFLNVLTWKCTSWYLPISNFELLVQSEWVFKFKFEKRTSQQDVTDKISNQPEDKYEVINDAVATK